MKINIIYNLYHDGDFRIENPEEINCQKINDWEYAGTKEAREFLEEFLCEHLRVGASHYWILGDFCTMIDSLIEFIEDYESGNVMKVKRLSGNYEGTEIIVKIEED